MSTHAPAGDAAIAPLSAHLRTTDIPVPPYPAVALALAQLDPARTTLAELAQLVGADAALAASTLRRARAVALGGAAPTTLHAAIHKLGYEELHQHVLAVGLGARATAAGPLVELRRDVWRRAILASVFAKELAPARGLSAGVASLAGLVHDIGELVVLAALEPRVAAAARSAPVGGPVTFTDRRAAADAWRDTVALLHVDIGGVVAARWGLAAPLTAAILHHHAPTEAPPEHRALVELITAVDHAIALLDANPAEGLSALAILPALAPAERARLGAVLPRVAREIDQYEHPAPRGPQAAVAPRCRELPDGWRVDLGVALVKDRQAHAFRAVALSPTAFAFRATVPFAPAWLVELTLSDATDALTMLAHVTACEPAAADEHLVIARPYGLGGEAKATWLRLLERTRPVARRMSRRVPRAP